MIPGPTNLPSEVVRAMARPAISHRAEEFHTLFEDSIEKIRRIFYTSNDVFILTASGTGGVECALTNTITKGDKIIVPVYGEFSKRGKAIAERTGAKCVTKEYPLGEGLTYEDAKKLIDENSDAQAIFLVYNDTSPGVEIHDLPKICKYAKSKGLVTIVDAISIAGGDYLKIDDWEIDLCVIGTQKCLASPPGISIITVSEDAWHVISKKNSSSYYFDLKLYKKFSEKKETPFTPAIHLIYALNEGLSIILSQGVKQWIARHHKNRSALAHAFTNMKFAEYVKEPFRSTTVLSFTCPHGITPGELVSRLYAKTRILVARGMGELREKIIRVGNMGITSLREILELTASIAYILSEYEIDFDLSKIISEIRTIYES